MGVTVKSEEKKLETKQPEFSLVELASYGRYGHGKLGHFEKGVAYRVPTSDLSTYLNHTCEGKRVFKVHVPKSKTVESTKDGVEIREVQPPATSPTQTAQPQAIEIGTPEDAAELDLPDEDGEIAPV